MLETASGATTEMGNMVQRVRQLTLQGISDSSTPAQRAMMQNEADELIAEIDNIAKDTQFNNRNLLDGSGKNISIQTGDVAGQTFNISIESLTAEDLQLKGLDIITNSSEALSKVDAAVSQVVGAQAEFGVHVALLTQAVESLLNSSLSFEAARGRIIDANYAHDTTTLASKTIMGQAAMAMVSQANQQPKAVHHLLKVESNKSL
jgi:flagellin